MRQVREFLSYLFIILAYLLCCASVGYTDECTKAVELYNVGTKSSDYSKKVKLFTEALTLCDDPEVTAKIHNNLGDALEHLGRSEEAVKEYKEALRIDKTLSTPYFSLGDHYFEKGDYEYAIEWYEMGLDLTGDETAEKNLKIARGIIPDYKSKKDIVAALDPSRALGVVPKIDFKIQFDYNSDKINAASEPQLGTIAAALKEDLKEYRFNVIGHTCDIGSDEYNMDLSLRRASSVVKYLGEKLGLSTSRFIVKGMGEKQPVDTSGTDAGREKNRRVEFVNVGM